MYNKQYSKQWYQQNKERILQQEKERREADPEFYKQKAKKYYSTNEAKEKAKEWRQRNKEKRNEQQKEYYQRNKEKCLEQKRKHYQEHKQQDKQRNKKWRMKKRQEKKQVFYELEKQFKHTSFPGFEGLYEIFQNGQIWIEKSCKFMKLKMCTDGYYLATLQKGKEKKYAKAHRLIAIAFDDRKEEELKDLQCHHIDISMRNNALENLVFMNSRLHGLMHDFLDKELIKSLGDQVKHLRGSQKTKQFEKLVREQISNELDKLKTTNE